MLDKEHYKPGLARNKTLVEQLTEFQKNPKSLVFVSLAESYRVEGMVHLALDVIEEGLQAHPDLGSALLLKAKCFFDLKRFGEALQVIQKILTQNPENLRAYKLQATIFTRLGQRKSAIKALVKVVSLFPQDQESTKLLEELENLEYGTNIPVALIPRASSDAAPATLGKIEEFQVGSFSNSLASIGALTESQSKLNPTLAPKVEVEMIEEEPTFATRTIAELYLRQGLKPKAKSVLKKILKDNPANQWARETLQDLESDGIVAPPKEMTPSPLSKMEKKAKVLERLLARVRLMKQVGA